MRWLIISIVFLGITGASFLASVRGWGLPGALEQPISIRDHSVQARGTGAPAFLYFGGQRRHVGGGFRGGK